MPMELHIRRIIVFATDLEAARGGYEGILGLAWVPVQDGFMRFRGGNFQLDVFECERTSAFEGYSERAGVGVVFSVRSVEQAMRELRSKGASVLHQQPNEAPDGSRHAAFVDPFGTVPEIAEDVRSAWCRQERPGPGPLVHRLLVALGGLVAQLCVVRLRAKAY